MTGSRIVTAMVAAGMLLAAAQADALDPVNKTLFGGVAIKGYDPVAYFTDGVPVEGKKEYEYRWMNAVWRFASAAHRAAFEAMPEKYAPAYGGYCAWAVAQGDTASIDPSAWKIVEGRLYLNYSKKVQQTWAEDIAGNIARADANWPKLLAK